ncbi:MAG: zinc-ribbon domain-containing protein, partial [Lachnospiraceae bacterium]|nr:zinc-ribbon domain-containing protein [Lachnospiraceae bacterium]
MICRQCGSEVQEGSVFCPHCGVRLQEAAGVRAEGQSETAVPKEVVREAADVRAAVQEEAVDVKTAAPEENVKEAPDMPEFEMAEQKKPEGPEQRAERSWQPEAASVTAADVPVIGAEASGAVSSTAANTSSAAAAVPSAAMKPEKPKGKKKVVIVGIAIAAVIVAAVLLAAALFPKGSQEWDVYGKDAIYCIQSDDEIKILNIASGKVTKGPETSYVVSSRTSIDATKQYIFSYDGLYLVSGDTWTEVSDEHTAGGVQMSVYGDGIVYLTVDADDGYEMYLYDTAKKESVLVTEERLWANCSIVISADGKSVAYMDGQSNRCCLYINGKEQEDTIKGAYPIALSSGGKYFYYVKNSSFYVMEQGKDAQKLGDEPSRLIFNKDMTQLLYSCNSKTYFCKNGEKAEETVAKGTVFPILPDNVQSLQDTVYTENDSCSVTVYGIKDLSGLVCDINDGLYYIDKDMSAQRIVSSYTVCEVSADGTALLYLRGDSLYRVKN